MTNDKPRRLRAPQEDGAALIDPPLSEVAALVAANQAAALNRDADLGMPQGFCLKARRALLADIGESEPAAASLDLACPLIMAGHQPTLFHPGVWFKKFLLTSIAKHVGGKAVNLVVDNDTIRTASIKVPSGEPSDPRLIDVPFDAQGEEVPWERRYLLQPNLFRTFDRRVREALRTLLNGRQGLLLDRLWPDAVRACDEEAAAVAAAFEGIDHGETQESLRTYARPGQCLAKARHQLERHVGLATEEVEISSVFFWGRFFQFAQLLIRRHQEIWAIYNAVLHEYRWANHIRSRSHPVPELDRDGKWYEVPLWIWSHDRPHRRRAFVRQVGSSWKLTDRQGIEITPEALEPSKKMAALQDAERHGIKIRPRALITTMYARLVLSDLFIHGIGGAKYDELTDEIIRRFFGIEPPAYLTATATFRLPIERPQVTAEDLRAIAQRIRDVRYRPESFLGDPLLAREPAIAQPLAALAAEKKNYLASHRLRRGAREEYLRLDRLNRAMHDLLQPVEEHLRREQARLIEETRRARLLGSREFSFVLFPEEFLVPRLLELSKVPA